MSAPTPARYRLQVEQKPGCLHAIATGRNTRENVAGYFDELFGECIARGCYRVLIEERLEGPRGNPSAARPPSRPGRGDT